VVEYLDSRTTLATKNSKPVRPGTKGRFLAQISAFFKACVDN
jgi:hypothetical protein